jgi:protein-tyrosine kinase
MENIRQAVERARNRQGARSEQRVPAPPGIPFQGPDFSAGAGYEARTPVREIELDSTLLQSNRVVAHVGTHPLSPPFDMLRTQILRSMDKKNAKIIAVTSPTPACGKTFTALNLALSIARQPERSVLLVDLDFRRPKVATSLGLEPDGDVLTVLNGQSRLQNAILHVRVGNQRLKVLPTYSASGSSELMGSRAMAAMFQDIKRDYRSEIVIVDLPPLLSSDDVIAILPQVDCVLLVVAVGTSTIAQIEECKKHLQSVDVTRVVLNKVPETSANYHYY